MAMRPFMSGLCLLLALLLFAAPVTAADCSACTYFGALRPSGGSDLYEDILTRLRSRTEARVSLVSGAFCDNGPGASVAADLIRAADEQFDRLSTIEKKIEDCPRACAPRLDEAGYCAYGARLVIDRYRLGAIGLRLAELGRLYGRAADSDQPPIQSLAAELTRHGRATMAVLKRSQSMLASGELGETPDTGWDASATEVTGLFDAVTLLADFSLITGDVAQIEAALETVSRQINTLRNDLQLVARRGKPLDGREQLAFDRRILTAAAELAYVMASLQGSAAATIVADDTTVTVRRAAVCLNQLSHIAISGSEAPNRVDGLLNACRSFADCGDKSSINVPANISPLRAFLQDQGAARRQTRSLVESICTPE